MLSSSSTSGPYPGSSGPSSSPTPPPSTVTPPSISPGSPATTATTIRPSPPNPLPLLNEIRDQVRALWEGQLSTNHLLDEIRGLRGDPQGNEVLERMRRVENLLESLLDRSAPVLVPQEPVIVPEAGAPPSPSMSSSSASRSISLIDLPPHVPIAPVAQPPPSGISLARHLEEILSQGIQPSLRRAVPPDPLRSFDYVPLPREHTYSPIRRAQRTVDESPASRFATTTAPSGPSSERPDYQMGDTGRQQRRPTNIPPPQPVVRYFFTESLTLSNILDSSLVPKLHLLLKILAAMVNVKAKAGTVGGRQVALFHH
ncbi:hypothetical protein F5050DRAFT_904453 [Lentinula boryana]|uniref:Uncharacterized protein n=1 Tax=Lentinula boryana TaxID=40481 RepID=A0ABQ8Q1S6_9AGAR|nr:hypothetical protein F5050DRAFT_904453 [Lentinula boryana]